MNYFTKIIFILLYISISTSQIIEEHSLFDENGIEVDVFAFQIPENYNPNIVILNNKHDIFKHAYLNMESYCKAFSGNIFDLYFSKDFCLR